MPEKYISEYAIDPREYIRRLIGRFKTRCPELSERTVEEAFFVDGGPVDYLVWFALEGYESHTFFYHDESPNPEALQRFIAISPREEAVPRFKALLREQYDTYRELEIARLLELPDTYLPQLGQRPRANLGFCHEPGDDRIVTGASGTPRPREQEIFDDIDKIVPDGSIEEFVSRTAWMVNQQIEADADKHTIDADVRERLEADPDFRRETTKPLPKGIHPQYTGSEAELWQKPASRVEHMDGSQGFLRVWIPVDGDGTALVDATAGEYDREEIVDAIRDDLEAAVC